eukprot:CAMPEP_0185027938 /NCGR_PEP_ID=MMETSP1103-20130426/13301_1 /TAXON_ID=36769 /ORGANISM="Paraphysomonas bandaiensis, Strain Caron Lab Isolate" /LENGTH=95 /DNA_ID=CAMNT_0027562143 /DNA_START=433 /DNA_END=720 /DNA_ORIENTATION=+
MTIRWEMPNVGNQCAYYFCVTPFNDIAVAHHTKLAISSICDLIRAANPQFGVDWGVAYLLTKPLDFLNQQNPANANAMLSRSDAESDDDDDEEEE